MKENKLIKIPPCRKCMERALGDITKEKYERISLEAINEANAAHLKDTKKIGLNFKGKVKEYPTGYKGMENVPEIIEDVLNMSFDGIEKPIIELLELGKTYGIEITIKKQ